MKNLLSLFSVLLLSAVVWLLLNIAPVSSPSAESTNAQVDGVEAHFLDSDGLSPPKAAISASDTSELPTELQDEIRTLSSRDNNDLVVEQVSPTLYRADLTGVHQVVPVATVNDDGTVSITEY